MMATPDSQLRLAVATAAALLCLLQATAAITVPPGFYIPAFNPVTPAGPPIPSNCRHYDTITPAWHGGVTNWKCDDYTLNGTYLLVVEGKSTKNDKYTLYAGQGGLSSGCTGISQASKTVRVNHDSYVHKLTNRAFYSGFGLCFFGGVECENWTVHCEVEFLLALFYRGAEEAEDAPFTHLTRIEGTVRNTTFFPKVQATSAADESSVLLSDVLGE